MRDIDACELGPQFLLRNGPDRPADIGKSHDQPERECYSKRSNKSDYPRNRYKCRSDIDSPERIRHVDGARIGAESVKERIFDDDGDSKSDQQHIAVIAA